MHPTTIAGHGRGGVMPRASSSAWHDGLPKNAPQRRPEDVGTEAERYVVAQSS